MAITLSYVGARGDHLPLGGTVDTVVNINQLDPKYLSLTAAQLSAADAESVLRQRRRRRAGDAGDAGRRAQSLRPFPQFLNIQDRQVSEGVNRYNAVRRRVDQAADARAGSAAASATPTAC